MSSSYGVDYIHEPFNPECGLPEVDQLLYYVDDDQSKKQFARDSFRKIKRYTFNLTTGYYLNDSWLKKQVKRITGSRGQLHLLLAKLNPWSHSAVIKDPVGCLLTGFFASEFPIQAIAIIRHPAAVVASMNRLGWDCHKRLRALIEQDFPIDLPEENNLNSLSNIEAGAWLWTNLNRIIVDDVKTHENIELIKHEDFCHNPVSLMKRLFDTCNLTWSQAIQSKVEQLTSKSNKSSTRQKTAKDFKRNPRNLLKNRLKELSRRERNSIYDITADISEEFYDRESFMLNQDIQ